jgi:hypothetical protein
MHCKEEATYVKTKEENEDLKGQMERRQAGLATVLYRPVDDALPGPPASRVRVALDEIAGSGVTPTQLGCWGHPRRAHVTWGMWMHCRRSTTLNWVRVRARWGPCEISIAGGIEYGDCATKARRSGARLTVRYTHSPGEP